MKGSHASGSSRQLVVVIVVAAVLEVVAGVLAAVVCFFASAAFCGSAVLTVHLVFGIHLVLFPPAPLPSLSVPAEGSLSISSSLLVAFE